MNARKPYRRNVGIALFNRQGLVFAGRARSSGPERVWPGAEWQMPQGGLDPGEGDVVAAARREMREETGVSAAVLLAMTPDWWTYDFPPYDGPPHKLTRFAGQSQRWIAFRFEGTDAGIDISGPNGEEPPEFLEWRWMRLEELARIVVDYKRPTYEKLLAAFADFAR